MTHQEIITANITFMNTMNIQNICTKSLNLRRQFMDIFGQSYFDNSVLQYSSNAVFLRKRMNNATNVMLVSIAVSAV